MFESNLNEYLICDNENGKLDNHYIEATSYRATPLEECSRYLNVKFSR